MKEIDEYINKSTWRISNNANWNFSFSGLQGHVAGTTLAKDALDKFGEIGNKHKDGWYHLHNLEGGKFGRYCSGNDLMKLLQEGLYNPVGVSSKPAKHLNTAIDHIVNLTYILTSEWQGAQAWVAPDILLAPYIWKDRLSYEQVKQEVQRMIWAFSFPQRPNFQTPFVNLTFGLRPSKYFKNLIPFVGKEQLMENTYDDFQNEIDMFNLAFLDIMIEGAEGNAFTFPLPTYNITPDFKWKNFNNINSVEYKIFELASIWGSPYFANYIKSGMNEDDSLSMCPLGGNEKVLIESTRYKRFEYSKISSLEENKEYKIYSDGKFVNGKFNKYNNQNMIKITLANNHTIEMSEEHLNLIKRNKESKTENIIGKNLNKEMYLPYSLNTYDGDGGNYDFGYFIGAYAGDGCLSDYHVNFSLCKDGIKNNKCVNELIRISKEYFGANYELTPDKDTRLLTLKIYSKALVGMCNEFVNNKKSEKHYTPKIFEMNKEFRQGVINGHLDTDGGNRHRIYTSSIKMVETLNMLCATLGTTTAIQVDDRKTTTIHDIKYDIKTIYSVLIYQLNRESYGDIWFKSDNKLWIKIKSIEKTIKTSAYCFEVLNDEPIFTVGTTGILTHNCRLKIDLKEVQRASGGIWNFGNNTGSLAVFTINMSRLGYLSHTDEEFYKLLDKQLEDAKTYLLKKKEFVKEGAKIGLFPMTTHFIGDKINKTYFLTIGINGLNECSINYCGLNIIENTDWCEEVLKYIKQKVLQIQIDTGELFNFEATPAEGCSYSLARLDKEKYNDIFTQGDINTTYYTGSSMIPMNVKIDVESALKHQERLQRWYTGGTIFHIDEGIELSPRAIGNYIKHVCENYTLPYITWSPTYSQCLIHGKKFGKKCCDEADESTRVVGYYRPTKRFNIGKKQEFKEKEFLMPNHHFDENGDVIID